MCSKKEHQDTLLLDSIFSWSYKDVLNKDLYKDKVKQIPKSFSSTADYLNSFMYPLIEETHAEFCSALENVAKSPVCQITKSRIKQCSSPPLYNILTKKIIDDLHPNNNNNNNNQNDYYLPKSGDIILLTSSRLKKVEDLNDVLGEEAFVMGYIKNGSQLFSNYNIFTSKKIGSHLMPHKTKRLFATYMINLTSNMRVLWGLRRNPESSNFSLLQRVLHYDHHPSSEQNAECCDDGSLGTTSVSDLISSFNLDKSQKTAILSSISMKNCSHNHHNSSGCSKVKLIWGPPGTGKTKTVASLLFTLLNLKCRTLTCAPTNIAVVQVVKRLISLVSTSPDTYGNCLLGDIVLFGNSEKMIVDKDDDLSKVFLRNRVRILNTYTRKWKATLGTIMSLLSGPNKKQQNGCNKMALVLSSDMNFCSLAETLMLCANHLFTHLPASYIQLEVESDTFKLIDQLKKLEIARKHVNHFNELILKRIELQAYCTKLYLLFLESKGKEDKWDDLCLSNACLIFCTASNSIKVNTNVEMVIIDEAAQLKEADSVIPMSISGVRSAVLIGDDRQLPAMVQSKVIYTDDFKISVASIDSKKTQQQVQDMLKRIANGRHHQPNSDDNEDMASVAIDGIAAELLRIFKVVDDDEQLLFYLTWCIDVQKEESNFTQVIKVWDILLASKIPQLTCKQT